MGATAALFHADRDPSIAGLVLDSPLPDPCKIADEVYQKYGIGMTGYFYSLSKWYVKRWIRNNANFSVYDLKPRYNANNSFIPALFIVPTEDNFLSY